MGEKGAAHIKRRRKETWPNELLSSPASRTRREGEVLCRGKRMGGRKRRRGDDRWARVVGRKKKRRGGELGWAREKRKGEMGWREKEDGPSSSEKKTEEKAQSKRSKLHLII